MTPLVPNPLNQVARAGVGLLAIYLGIRASMQVTYAISSSLEYARALDSEHALGSAIESGGLSLGVAFLFSMLPAWLLFKFRDVAAEKLASVNEPGPALAISGSAALCVGCAVLALALAVDGAAGVAATIAMVGFAEWTGVTSSREAANPFLPRAMQAGVVALVQIVSAGVLWRYARRLGVTRAT